MTDSKAECVKPTALVLCIDPGVTEGLVERTPAGDATTRGRSA